MRLNLRELVLKYKGRPIEWGLGAWAVADRWCPYSKTNMQQNPKKKRNYEKMIEKNDPLKYDLHLNHVPFEFEVDERWLCVGRGR